MGEAVIIYYCGNHYLGKVKKETNIHLILDDCCKLIAISSKQGIQLGIGILDITTPFSNDCKFHKGFIVKKMDGTKLYEELRMQRMNLVKPNSPNNVVNMNVKGQA